VHADLGHNDKEVTVPGTTDRVRQVEQELLELGCHVGWKQRPHEWVASAEAPSPSGFRMGFTAGVGTTLEAACEDLLRQVRRGGTKGDERPLQRSSRRCAQATTASRSVNRRTAELVPGAGEMQR
jgi:hypothetical protein